MATANTTSNSANSVANATSEGAEQATAEPLTLPEPSGNNKSTKLDVASGQAVKLDHLGPMVVNRDGTLSRISNWEQMTDIERQNTLRILGKRNQLRMETLKAEDDANATAK